MSVEDDMDGWRFGIDYGRVTLRSEMGSDCHRVIYMQYENPSKCTLSKIYGIIHSVKSLFRSTFDIFDVGMYMTAKQFVGCRGGF